MTVGSIGPSGATLDEGRRAIDQLRRALMDVTAAAGGDINRPQDLSRRFKLDKTLTWRISRAVRETDPWQALEHLPSRTGVSIYSASMRAAGVAEAKLSELDDACDQFERFVADHATDRSTLDVMVSAPERRSSVKRLETLRKGGFACNASLLGVRAATHFTARIVVPHPQRPESSLAIALLAGLSDLFRLRADVPWPVCTLRDWRGTGEVLSQQGDNLHPLSEQDVADAPIVRSYCSPKDVRLERQAEADGTVRYLLQGGPIGASAATSVVYGWVNFTDASRRPTVPGERGEHAIVLSTPVERLVFDFIVHRSLEFAHTPRAEVYAQFPGLRSYPQPEAHHARVPVPTTLQRFGSLRDGG
ncbi:MAG: hypothetical protein MUE97_00065, partial [Phycisphaerales bacterium]|nr:hypothetical protein [Phycisphaerales bacterium]